MKVHDTPGGYGWLSIGLHWAAAISVIMLWFIGNQMTADDTPPERYAELLRVHTSVAVAVYALLLFRVFRRLQIGFPGRTADQPPRLFRIALIVHMTLLLAILMMLFSGPLAVWSGGDAIGLFTFGELASPFAEMSGVHDLLTTVHRIVAKILLVVFIIHITGAFRQILFAKSETSNRMLVATSREPD